VGGSTRAFFRGTKQRSSSSSSDRNSRARFRPKLISASGVLLVLRALLLAVEEAVRMRLLPTSLSGARFSKDGKRSELTEITDCIADAMRWNGEKQKIRFSFSIHF
jgi:hypothetical protein